MIKADNIAIAEFLYTLTKYSKLCRQDLEIALEGFIKNEEYEKCSVLKDLIDSEYYDNNAVSNYTYIKHIQDLINKIDNRENKLRYINELTNFINNIEQIYGKTNITIPPFKNPKNIGRFLNFKQSF
ncbi:MAG: hypothetical protein WCK13_03745 [Ignavibacteriota bacterium]